MNLDCHEARDRFDELVDGLLPVAERRDVEGHVAGCNACADELASLQALLAEARALPRELRPTRNLWPGIEARLPAKRRGPLARLAGLVPRWSGLLSPQGLAAAAAALALVALGAVLWRGDAPTGTAVPTVTESAVLSRDGFSQRAELARSEDGVLLARQDLLEAVEGPKEHLSPETVAVIEENMRIIDEAIGEIRSALEDDPLNHQLNMLLAAQYQQEAELLKRVSGV